MIEQDDPKNPKIIEEIYEEFVVDQPNAEKRVIENEAYRQKKLKEHNYQQPTQQDTEKARVEGYWLASDWKTQFTIRAFKGCRLAKEVIKQVADEYSSGDIQSGLIRTY